MIKKFRLDNGLNDYATIYGPDDHEEERKQLIEEGYIPWSTYFTEDGEQEELWVKQEFEMHYSYPVMRKGLCYFSTKKHHKKSLFRKAFAREMVRVKNILIT